MRVLSGNPQIIDKQARGHAVRDEVDRMHLDPVADLVEIEQEERRPFVRARQKDDQARVLGERDQHLAGV